MSRKKSLPSFAEGRLAFLKLGLTSPSFSGISFLKPLHGNYW